MSDKPEFKFPVSSWGDSKRFAVLQARLRQLGRGDLTAEETEAVFNDLDRMLARFVTYVPRAWLVEGAPENLDWSDPASFEYMLTARMVDLQAALAEARSPQETAGNSETR